MADLLVDVNGLLEISGAITHVHDGLNNTRATIDAARPDLGSGEVWDALDAFENHWHDGREQISKNLEAVQQALERAAQSYGDADHKLATALTQHDVQVRRVTAR